MNTKVRDITHRAGKESLHRINKIAVDPKSLVCCSPQRSLAGPGEMRVWMQHADGAGFASILPSPYHKGSVEIRPRTVQNGIRGYRSDKFRDSCLPSMLVEKPLPRVF